MEFCAIMNWNVNIFGGRGLPKRGLPECCGTLDKRLERGEMRRSWMLNVSESHWIEAADCSLESLQEGRNRALCETVKAKLWLWQKSQGPVAASAVGHPQTESRTMLRCIKQAAKLEESSYLNLWQKPKTFHMELQDLVSALYYFSPVWINISWLFVDFSNRNVYSVPLFVEHM